MTAVDPLELLTGLDTPLEPREEFAGALLASCLAELEPRIATRPRALLPFAAALLLFVLAAAATATYLVLRGSTGSSITRPAHLTVIVPVSARTTGTSGLARIAEVAASGRLRTVWRCPHRTWCGVLTSLAWSPDGRRFAMTLGEVGGVSGYVGLHVIDVATGRDVHVGAPAIPYVERRQPPAVLERLVRATTKAVGCALPHEVAWAPDSTRLAFVCGDDLLQAGVATSLFVIRADGTHRRRVRTGTVSAYWPSWSPNGKRLAFATEPGPRVAVRRDSTQPVRHLRSSVYTIRLDGTGRTLVAHTASAPAWSPDGSTIAYDAPCGVLLATRTGRGRAWSTERPCIGIVGRGGPAWSPDGRTLAVQTKSGVDVVGAGQTTPHRLTTTTGGGVYGVGRPAWAPDRALERLLGRQTRGGV